MRQIVCFVLGLLISEVDSLAQDSIGFRSDGAINIGLYLGGVVAKGELTKPEPILNELSSKTGFSIGLQLEVRIPKFKQLSILLETSSASLFPRKDFDNSISEMTIDEENWLQYDPNNQFGLQNYFNSAYLISQFTSWDGIECLNRILGAKWALSVRGSDRFFLTAGYGFGYSKVKFAEYDAHLEQTLFFQTGYEDYSIKIDGAEQASRLNRGMLGLKFLVAKNLVLNFDFSKYKIEKADFNLSARFYQGGNWVYTRLVNYSFTPSFNTGTIGILFNF